MKRVVLLLSLGIIALSLYKIADIGVVYIQEQNIRRQMQPYSPQSIASVVDSPAADGDGHINPEVAQAKELNPDIVGWLRLDGTSIDYPFVQGPDNDYYLRRDINGGYSYAGTLFIDSRSSGDLSEFSSIIYGHNMLNGTMFSDILSYKDVAFFNSNDIGWLFLEDATYQLEIFAYMEIPGNDPIVYRTDYDSEREMQRTLEYVVQRAQRYRDLSLTHNDRIVMLSTCTTNLDEMRSVLLARLVKAA